jgi:hypothetical protein
VRRLINTPQRKLLNALAIGAIQLYTGFLTVGGM